MTKLSVNVNKIALLRNSRGRDYPSVLEFARRCLDLGAHGLTLHPRPDQRHARYGDVHALKGLCREYGAELNVEGYPGEAFMETVLLAKPDQCTLVPDAPEQVTSDHGWEVQRRFGLLRDSVGSLEAAGVRSSLFLDCGSAELPRVKELGASRIELYTEPYAASYAQEREREAILESFSATAAEARALGLGVNAGHDLSLENLDRFLCIEGIEEVSIGHALVVECIEFGIEYVLGRYLDLVSRS